MKAMRRALVLMMAFAITFVFTPFIGGDINSYAASDVFYEQTWVDDALEGTHSGFCIAGSEINVSPDSLEAGAPESVMETIAYGGEIDINIYFYQNADSEGDRLYTGGMDDEMVPATVPKTADSSSKVQIEIRDRMTGNYYYSNEFPCKVRKVDSDFMEGKGTLTITLPAKGKEMDASKINLTALENTMQIAACNNKCKVAGWGAYDLNKDGKDDVYVIEDYAPDLEQYICTESDAVDVGAVTKTFTITEGMSFNKLIGIGSGDPNYKLEYFDKVTFKFPRRSISKGTVSLKSASLVYTGSYLKPTITAVKVNGKTLVKDTDFTVSGSRKAIGSGKITITGKGKYTGTLTKSFTVKPGKVSISSATGGTKKLTVKWGKKGGDVKYQVKYRVKGASTWKTVYTTYTSKTIKELKSGKTYQVKVRAYKKVSGKTYYGAFSDIKSVKVK